MGTESKSTGRSSYSEVGEDDGNNDFSGYVLFTFGILVVMKIQVGAEGQKSRSSLFSTMRERDAEYPVRGEEVRVNEAYFEVVYR